MNEIFPDARSTSGIRNFTMTTDLFQTQLPLTNDKSKIIFKTKIVYAS